MFRGLTTFKRAVSVFPYRGTKPTIDSSSFIAPNAIIMGDVQIKDNVAVLYNAVIRGDNDTITIGSHSNIQEASILHTDPGIKLTLGDYVTVGHKAMLHGCTVGDNTIVGMGATIMNRAVVGKNCIIGANALITENKVIPDGSVVVGSPYKIVREVTEKDIEMIKRTAEAYYSKVTHFKESHGQQ